MYHKPEDLNLVVHFLDTFLDSQTDHWRVTSYAIGTDIGFNVLFVPGMRIKWLHSIKNFIGVARRDSENFLKNFSVVQNIVEQLNCGFSNVRRGKFA